MNRIAMWSGPRNISTAMMRAFENRADTVVVDEPFYAHYLRTTGLAHPGAEDVLAAQDNDWRSVAKTLCDVDVGVPVFYQKQMAHHFCGDMDFGWVDRLTHGFLLRDPRSMLLSLSRVLDRVTLADTGMEQQKTLFDHLRANGLSPPVIDSRDVLEAPEYMLRALCSALSIDFDPAMLQWPAGSRDSDGVWAPHWYSAVEKSTGFAPYEPATGQLPPELNNVLGRCQTLYDELYAWRIRPSD